MRDKPNERAWWEKTGELLRRFSEALMRKGMPKAEQRQAQRVPEDIRRHRMRPELKPSGSLRRRADWAAYLTRAASRKQAQEEKKVARPRERKAELTGDFGRSRQRGRAKREFDIER